MKFNFIEEFTFSESSQKVTSYCYLPRSLSETSDILFIGSEQGKIQLFQHLKRSKSRLDNVTRESAHSGPVTCLLFTNNKKICGNGKGYLVSGSNDRTIKVFSPFSTKGTSFIQTLFGHEGTILSLADCHDGSILSISIDGDLRVWAPQNGRQLMLNPFFENSFYLPRTKTSVGTWFTVVSVEMFNIWTCYLGDSS
eukprot:gene14373-30608_t